MKKLLKSETFLFCLIMFILVSLMWYRTSAYYDQILEGTKLQVLKKDTPKHLKKGK